MIYELVRMDKPPVHTTRAWTALRVRDLTTLSTDALRLPNSHFIFFLFFMPNRVGAVQRRPSPPRVEGAGGYVGEFGHAVPNEGAALQGDWPFPRGGHWSSTPRPGTNRVFADQNPPYLAPVQDLT